MAEYLISQSQLETIKDQFVNQDPHQNISEKWEKLTEEQKKVVIDVLNHLYPNKNLKEAQWYNTAMDFLGIIDPTPITDIINGISYFSQGDKLFGILSLISAVPLFGDVIGKSVMGAAKLGTNSTKALERAMTIMKTASPGSKQYIKAGKLIDEFAKAPNALGKLIQKLGGKTGDNVVGVIDSLPLGPFNGIKNLANDYIKILQSAGKKSLQTKTLAKSLAGDFAKGTAKLADVTALRDLVKGTKIFDAASLSKPGGLSQIFFGGIPRLFRSPEGRRIKIMMGQTKWWLGFLDYLGIGNFVGPEELSEKMSDGEMMKKIEQYNATPQARKNFEDEFGKIDKGEVQKKYGDIVRFQRDSQGGTTRTVNQSPPLTRTSPQTTTSSKSDEDPMPGFLRNVLLGKLNPIPFV